MTRIVAALFALPVFALTLSACGSEPAEERVESTEAVPVSTVRVAVFGAIVEDPRGHLEVCDDEHTPCPGVPVDGDGVQTTTDRVRVVGAFDGVTLHVTEPPTAAPDAPFDDVEFPIPCDAPAGGWPAYSGHELSPINAAVDEAKDRYSGMWLGDGGVIVVGVPRGTDRAAAEAELGVLDPGAPVCVTEMEHSTAEVEAARAATDVLLEQRGVTARQSWGDVINNRTTFDVWRIDQQTLDDIAAASGNAVAIFPSFVVLDATVADLPSPPPVDDPNAVPVVTQPFPTGISMTALGHFTLEFDATADCFYFAAGETRILPIWRYGTTATRTPAQILDFDERVVWTVGETRSIGGGDSGRPLDPATSCGATSAWVAGAVD